MPTTGLWLALALIAAGPVEDEARPPAPGGPPRSLDDRLVVELFAEAPEIVTPVGVAVDAGGGVLVVESHTHFRPEGYDGPPADRIRRFEDTDDDGRADRVTTFFEGTTHTMSVAIDPRDGSVLVATRAEVFRLRDDDGDGRADEPRTTLARLETAGDYPHNGLSGFALDLDGHIVFGFGENLGEPYRLIGADGTTLEGGGEGGNVYRMAPDGSGLERIATGFWNPFGLAFDPFGRLLVVDNDPDSRPPCRLLHVVPGGDYGFRFRNGRKGLHPFTAWNGELPGTLGMVAGTGEAPSGLVVYESDGLPYDYLGALLVTSWGDHRIEMYRLEPNGASFTATMRPLAVGGEDFRPVGIAIGADGALYVSDWVDRSYELHGRGRIWRVREAEPRRRLYSISPEAMLGHPDRVTREAVARDLAARRDRGSREVLTRTFDANSSERARALAFEALIRRDEESLRIAVDALDDDAPSVRALAVRTLPDGSFDAKVVAAFDPSPLVRAEALRRLDAGGAAGKNLLMTALESTDPFLRQAARTGIARSFGLPELIALARSPTPAHRLGALLVLRERPEAEAAAPLPRFLDDPDPTVRLAAAQWVAEAGLHAYRPELETALNRPGAVDARLFEAYLAALARLDGASSGTLDEQGGRAYAATVAADPERPDALRRRALRAAPPDHPALSLGVLTGLLDAPDDGLRLEAIRTLRDHTDPGRPDALRGIAADANRPVAERAEAAAGLTGGSVAERALLLDLAAVGARSLRREALRSLRAVALTEAERERLADAARGDAELVDLVAALSAADRMPDAPAADDLDAWLAWLDGPADPEAGERVFSHPQGPGCARCHAVDGRGGRVGPDLSAIGASMDRRRLVESILQPSKEVAPRFVPWLIARGDGTVATGVLADTSADGTATYVDAEGRPFTVAADEVVDRRPVSTSIMPEELPHAMTRQEFRDLLGYLDQNGPRAGSGEVGSGR